MRVGDAADELALLQDLNLASDVGAHDLHAVGDLADPQGSVGCAQSDEHSHCGAVAPQARFLGGAFDEAAAGDGGAEPGDPGQRGEEVGRNARRGSERP